MPKGVYKRVIGVNCGLPNQGFQKGNRTKSQFKKGHKGYKYWLGKTLSKKIRKKISLSQKGTKKPWVAEINKKRGKESRNWKGGITPLIKKIRNSSKMKKWRKVVFERDNFTCQICGERGCYLEVHHLKRFSDYPGLRFNIDNGIALCRFCHTNYTGFK